MTYLSSAPAGQGPGKGLSHVQTRRKFALFGLGFACLILLLTGRSTWAGPTHWVHEAIEKVGIALIVLAILGRTWCSLYIGGRKKAVIVDTGPYSLCRNPLYFFTFFGAAGVDAQFGSVSAALLVLILTFIVFYVVVMREEAWLTAAFGAQYGAYKASTPRFLPDWRGWKPVETLEIRPALVVLTFLDACLFLLAFPVAESLERLQHFGWLPVFWSLP